MRRPLLVFLVVAVLATVASLGTVACGRSGPVVAVGPTSAGRPSSSTAAATTTAAPTPSPSPSPGTASSTSTGAGPTTAGGSAADARLIAFDDFNGARLDPSRWRVYDALATNGVSRWSPDLVTVVDGELRITGTGRDPSGAGNVSGGVCWCLGEGMRTYGRWQVRARFESGTGFGQAILLWPRSERWPEDGEIDLVETPTGTKQTAEATVHWGTGANPRQDSARLAGDYTQWHVYTVDWQPGSVRIWVDDRLLYDASGRPGSPVVPTTPMSLALQQEPGPFGDNWVPAPTAATPAQVVMHIDWVRISSG